MLVLALLPRAGVVVLLPEHARVVATASPERKGVIRKLCRDVAGAQPRLRPPALQSTYGLFPAVLPQTWNFVLIWCEAQFRVVSVVTNVVEHG